jgi:hypothetical protein
LPIHEKRLIVLVFGSCYNCSALYTTADDYRITSGVIIAQKWLNSYPTYYLKTLEANAMYKSIEEVHRQYDGQWVYLIDLQVNERGTVIGGSVAAHSENRDNVVMKIDPGKGVYVLYAGSIPEGVSVIL